MKFSFLLFLLFLFSCKKDPNVDSTNQPPKLIYKAAFSIRKPCSQLLQDTAQFIDSAFIFTNMSRWAAQLPDTMPRNPDTLNKIKSYKWDFGDNTFSNNQHTSHAYSLPGEYKVSLFTYIDNTPSDTFSANVKVIIGQREIKTSYVYTTPVDIELAANNTMLLLLSSSNSFSDPPSYSLMKLDSLLKPAGTVNIPGNSIRLNSLKKLSNGDYILSGNFTNGNTGQFAITRITSDGTLVWTKFVNNLSGTNVYTIPTQDGGLLTIGDTINAINPFLVMVKCNANGDEVWRKSFNSGIGQSLQYPDNVVETATGFLFAAFKSGGSNGKVVLTATDTNGNITQQTETNAANSGTIFRVGVVKNGNVYMAYATNSFAGYFFTGNLAFVSSAMVSQTGTNHAISFNGAFYLAEGSHQYSYINKLSASGTQTWSSLIANYIPLSCSSVYSGVTRYCKKTLIFNNDVVALSYGQNNTSSFNSSSVYVEKFRQTDGMIR